MKTLSSKQYRQHDAITFSLFIAMMILIVVVALTHTSCATHTHYTEPDMSYMQDTAKWNAFLECSKDEGDMGCDSCFYLIFGYHAEDPGYLNYQPAKEE